MNIYGSRLNPTIINSRWYSLILLKEQLNIAIKQFLTGEKRAVRLIDFGCGNKPYEKLFSPYVEEYLGLDIKGNPSADFIIDENERSSINSNSADVVISTQVLEHVDDPAAYLSESYRMLRKDGLLIISTHGYWIYHPDPTDYWRWTSAGLKKILTEQGFEIEYFRGIIGRPAAGLHLLQDTLIFKIPKFLTPLISIPFQIAMYVFDKILTRQTTRDKDAGIFFIVCKAVKNDGERVDGK